MLLRVLKIFKEVSLHLLQESFLRLVKGLELQDRIWAPQLWDKDPLV
jgi:hypothetical protein